MTSESKRASNACNPVVVAVFTGLFRTSSFYDKCHIPLIPSPTFVALKYVDPHHGGR